MYQRKPHEIEEVIQDLKERLLESDINFDPKEIHHFFISNIVQRVLAHLVGTAVDKPIRLQATTAGILKVATAGTGFEHNDTKAGNAPDAYGTAIAFDQVCSRVDIFTYNFACDFKRTKDNITWDDEFEIPANFHYSYDGTTHSFNIKNETAGSVCRYVIIGWW